MKKLEESSVILRFSDDAGVIHDVGLDSILDGGMPIDEESGKDMEYLGVYALDDFIEPNVRDHRCLPDGAAGAQEESR